jgi:hypothetical protein
LRRIEKNNNISIPWQQNWKYDRVSNYGKANSKVKPNIRHMKLQNENPISMSANKQGQANNRKSAETNKKQFAGRLRTTKQFTKPHKNEKKIKLEKSSPEKNQGHLYQLLEKRSKQIQQIPPVCDILPPSKHGVLAHCDDE